MVAATDTLCTLEKDEEIRSVHWLEQNRKCLRSAVAILAVSVEPFQCPPQCYIAR